MSISKDLVWNIDVLFNGEEPVDFANRLKRIADYLRDIAEIVAMPPARKESELDLD